MWAPVPARRFAQVLVMALAGLSALPAAASPSAVGGPAQSPTLPIDRLVELDAIRKTAELKLAALGASSGTVQAARTDAAPFGHLAVPAPEGGLSRKWRGVQQQIGAEAEILSHCREVPETCPSDAARHFLAIISAGQARHGRGRLGEINRAINLAIRPMSDLAQYGVVDVWSSPLTTFTTGAGDCEDYAIAKYVALREAGMRAEDVRLLIVRDRKLHEDHAVIAARLDGHWLVLDNRRLLMLEDEQLTRYQPLFEIDDDGVRRLMPPQLARNAIGEQAKIPAASEAAPGAQ